MSAVGALLLLMGVGAIGRAVAQGDPPPVPDDPPFGLPLEGDPGPGSWTVIQWYGNTETAYHFRQKWYEAGQGLHFGLDFGAACGTAVVAIGDGMVVAIDDRDRGSGPHNLVIEHPSGFISLYGHLLEVPRLSIGQEVERGEVVGMTGDPDLTCDSRPHLHLEIRDLSYVYAYNPVDFIEADWNALALFGPRSDFQRDLENPRRWMTPMDQPVVRFWGVELNNYWNAWPPDWSR